MAPLLGPGRSPAAELRRLLAGDRAVVAPGAYDALSARIIEDAGFPAVYMTGYGTSASLLGRPDVGLLGMSEMAGNARRIASAVSVPVIADADTGYGNPINVVRTVREYEQAGVAGLHIEDQVAPKRCGHMTGKAVIPAAEMEEKVRAAVAARTGDLVVIARTDARAVEGIDAAIERAARYRDAGADVLFVEAPQSDEEIEQVATALAGTPLLFNWAEGGRTPPVGLDRLEALGFRLVLFPISALLAAAKAVTGIMQAIRRDGTPAAVMDRLVPFDEFNDFIGLPEIRDLEARFGGA
jgi:carboxyvinyl-carboxyphosphonate phosphorylmutase